MEETKKEFTPRPERAERPQRGRRRRKVCASVSYTHLDVYKRQHFLIGIAQHHSVMGVSRHAAHAEENQGFEAANILLRVPEQIQDVYKRQSGICQ